jgi:hypothetical protein
MIRSGTAASRAITSDNRRFTSRLSFNFSSLRRDSSVQIFAPNAVSGSISDQIAEAPGPYIQDRLFTGAAVRNRVFPSVQSVHRNNGWIARRLLSRSRVGYIGKQASADGSVNDLVAVRFSPRGISWITIQTGAGRIVVSGQVTVQDELTNILFQYPIEDNDRDTLVIPCQVSGAASISISITKGTPNKHIWLLTLAPIFTGLFTDNDIIDLKYDCKKTQNKEGSIGRLYLQTLDINLFNRDRSFDFGNFKSPLFNMLRKNVEITADLALSETDFSKSIGVFYADSWEVSEDKATVLVKAIDYLGSVKDLDINMGIFDDADVFFCFTAVAERLGLYENSVDPALVSVKLSKYAPQGKVSAVLNELCETSQSICFMNDAGTGLVVKRMSTIRGTSRYPLRYLTTHDYSKSDNKKTAGANPNLIEINYTTSEYETVEEIREKKTVLYADLPRRDFPGEYRGVPVPERTIGAGTEPSWEISFEKPEGYIKTEMSDSFLPEILEYFADDTSAPDLITVTVWVFEVEDEDAQLTAAVIGKSSHENILLESSNYTIEKKPARYRAPDPAAPTPEARNAGNEPQKFEIKLEGKYVISMILPGNKNIPGTFEFIITKTGTGCTVAVWNYLPVSQEFAVNIYGKRIIESKNTTIILFKNEDDYSREGEVRKTVTLQGLASGEIAMIIARTTAAYYAAFGNSFSLEPWADPRMEIGDFIAYESLRGYGYTQGIIEEISLVCKGHLEQKVKLLETKKHNRDCRVYGGYICNDRPAMRRDREGYV